MLHAPAAQVNGPGVPPAAPAGAHVGVALLPPPDKNKQQAKKEGKGAKGGKPKALTDGTRTAGSSGSGDASAAANDPASPRGLAGSQVAAPAAAQAADPLVPPKNRPGQAMLAQMRARGQRGASRAPGVPSAALLIQASRCLHTAACLGAAQRCNRPHPACPPEPHAGRLHVCLQLPLLWSAWPSAWTTWLSRRRWR